MDKQYIKEKISNTLLFTNEEKINLLKDFDYYKDEDIDRLEVAIDEFNKETLAEAKRVKAELIEVINEISNQNPDDILIKTLRNEILDDIENQTTQLNFNIPNVNEQQPQ